MSEFLKEYRVKFPEYNDLDDSTLVGALHSKYNADTGGNISPEEFHSAIGFSIAPAEPIGDIPAGGPSLAIGDEIPQQSMLEMISDRLPVSLTKGVQAEFDNNASVDIEQTGGRDIRNILQTFGARGIAGFEKGAAGIVQSFQEEATKHIPAGREEEFKDASLVDPTTRGELPKEMYDEAQAVLTQLDKDKPMITKGGETFSAVADSMFQQAPGMLVSIMTKNPSFALASMGANTFGQTYADSRARGLTPEDSLGNASVQSVAEMGTELLPFLKFAAMFRPGKKFSKKAIEMLIAEVPGEALATAVQNSSDAYFSEKDPEKRAKQVSDYLTSEKHWKQDQVDTLLQTVAQTLLMVGGAKTARTVADAIPESPGKELGKALKADVADSELVGAEEAARSAMSPENAQITATFKETPAFKALPPEDQRKVEAVIQEKTIEPEQKEEPKEQAIEPDQGQIKEITTESIPAKATEKIGAAVASAIEGRRNAKAITVTDEKAKLEGYVFVHGGRKTDKWQTVDSEGSAKPTGKYIVDRIELLETEGKTSPFVADALETKPVVDQEEQIIEDKTAIEPFKHQADIEAEAEASIMEESGLPADHPAHKKLLENRREKERTPDPVTGLIQVKHFQPTFDRAWKEHKDSSREFSYTEIDIRNLGGINASLGTSGADRHLKAISDIIKEEVSKASPEAQVFRKGGDEFGVIAPDLSSADIAKTLDKAQDRVNLYAEENGLSEIEHTKEGRAPGIGLVFASSNFNEYADPESVRTDVDTQVEAKKKGIEDVEQGEIAEIGAESPGGQAEPVESGTEEEAQGRVREEKEVSGEQAEEISYGDDPVAAYASYRKTIAEQTATVGSILADAKLLIKNKKKVVSSTSQKDYKEMLLSHVKKSYTIIETKNSKSVEEQSLAFIEEQTDKDILEDFESTPAEATMSRKGEITYPQPKEDQNTLDYELDNKVISPKAETFNAPGHNYVGLFRSTGIPERKEFAYINGEKVVIPNKPQRIEPIMKTLVDIVGRRIYFGKIKGNSRAGFFRPGVGEIRTKKKNDVEVLAHELAHYLDIQSNETLPNFKRVYTNKTFSPEVMALSYTDTNRDIQEIEGFAEFVRLWLTNSQESQTRAPLFHAEFNRILSRDRKLAAKMLKMQEQMHKFYFQGADLLGQALIGKSQSFTQDFNQWKYRRDSRIRQQTIDKFHAARKIEQELTGGIGNVQESAWKQLRISNGGAEGIADYIMNYGTVEFDANGDLKKTGISLHEVLAPVKKITLKGRHKGQKKIDLLMRYLAGRRALELHRQGRENLIPKETAIEWARLGSQYPVLESIRKEYQAFNDRMMDFYSEAGLLTPEGRVVMQKMNKDYVPFNRIREQLSGGGGAKSGFNRLKGGTANLNDILVNIQDGVIANVRSALNNRAKQRLYEYISGHKDGAIFATKIATDSKPVQVYQEEMLKKINQILDENGIEIDGEIDLTQEGLFTFWQHGVKPQLNESGNIVDSVTINGKPRYYEVQDPLLQDMLLSMNPESYSSFMNVMFGIKNFFTRTITLGVEFTGANLVRDTVGAAFLSKNNFVPFLSSFKGMYSYIAKDKHYQNFLKSGGGFSGRIEGTTAEGKARRRVKVDEFGVMTGPEKILSTIDHIMSAFEYGTRIGEFRISKKNNSSDMDAGFNAREISTDFAVIGANRFITGYIRTVPFLNAMVQSQDRIFREALVGKKYDGNPAGMAMKAFLGITIPTLALYLINKDDDDYKEIPDWEKRTNWHIKVGDGQFIKVPRPYDVGFAYATMPELFFKYLQDTKGKEFADGMLWTMTQMYGIDGVPAMMTGWWDIVKNEKWTGAPVIPKSLQDVSAPEQYTSNTSESFVRLGEVTGLSPIKAEHVFKAYSGYLGGYMMWATDQMLWDEEKFGAKPDRKASDNIFLRRFLTTDVRHSTAAMEKFFELKEKSDELVATFKKTVDVRRAIKGKMGKGRFKDDNFFGLSAKEKEVLFALNDSMNDLVKVMYGKEGIKTAELAIKYNKKLSGKEKRKKLDDLWLQRNDGFLKYYKQANQALQKAKREAEKGN